MPRISIRDPWAMEYGITSNNPVTLRMWFDEILPLVQHQHIDPTLSATIMISPMYKPGSKELDWPQGSHNGYVPFSASNGTDAMRELNDLRRTGPWPYEGKLCGHSNVSRSLSSGRSITRPSGGLTSPMNCP